MSVRISNSATIEDDVTIGTGTVVWDLTQVRSGARIGAECVLGRNVFVDAGVVLGDRCKVQNNALLFAPAELADGVFIGPAVVLSNDRFPRAVEPDGQPKRAGDWRAEGVRVDQGASIGAGAVLLAGITVGRWALVAAGSMVTRDVPAHALVAGNPAVPRGWVGRVGHRLEPAGEATWQCPVTGTEYVEISPDELREQE